jgi:hypothetical protein
MTWREGDGLNMFESTGKQAPGTIQTATNFSRKSHRPPLWEGASELWRSRPWTNPRQFHPGSSFPPPSSYAGLLAIPGTAGERELVLRRIGIKVLKSIQPHSTTFNHMWHVQCSIQSRFKNAWPHQTIPKVSNVTVYQLFRSLSVWGPTKLLAFGTKDCARLLVLWDDTWGQSPRGFAPARNLQLICLKKPGRHRESITITKSKKRKSSWLVEPTPWNWYCLTSSLS